MTNPQLYPLEINTKTKEPFLRLRKHKNIILTPPRWEDAPYLVSILNDPMVHEDLMGPPYPYTLEHGNDWVKLVRSHVEETLKELEDAKDEPTLKFVNRCPVTFLREVKEDGTDIFIGSIDMTTCVHGELMGPDGVDWENKEKREKENNSLELGDPRKIWCFGDYLASSHHRRGIMTDAVDTMLHEWAIPRMNVHHMWVSAFEGNEGSVKVFLKNGFKLKARYKEHFEVKGRIRGLVLLEWAQ
ncbi:acyl-CoA N-acyltransferase [Phlegmacium glaucopus]|nr:acyl-CoA N-acyltransferase [Phlegmacium glaucopus]